MKYIPSCFHDRVIVSSANVTKRWFNRYRVDYDLSDEYQPILYADVDIIFDGDVMIYWSMLS